MLGPRVRELGSIDYVGMQLIRLPLSITNTFKATDFKFGRHVPWDRPDRTPLKRYRKGGVARVT